MVFPFALTDGTQGAICFHDWKGKTDTIALEAVALIEIEDKVTEELVNRGRHGCLVGLTVEQERVGIFEERVGHERVRSLICSSES